MLCTTDPDADRAFLRDVLRWPSVPAGGPDDRRLIVQLPPSGADVGRYEPGHRTAHNGLAAP